MLHGLLEGSVKIGRRGGTAHEYWKYRLATYYKAQGYEVELENAIGDGKTVDLVPIEGDERTAVEVEIGNSNAVGEREVELYRS